MLLTNFIVFHSKCNTHYRHYNYIKYLCLFYEEDQKHG